MAAILTVVLSILNGQEYPSCITWLSVLEVLHTYKMWFRWPTLVAGKERLKGILCRQPVSVRQHPFWVFTLRPLECEQCCLSLHGIFCPLHLLNYSMERGDISSGIITVWGWQAPLSRSRWDQALQCLRKLKDTGTLCTVTLSMTNSSTTRRWWNCR